MAHFRGGVIIPVINAVDLACGRRRRPAPIARVPMRRRLCGPAQAREHSYATPSDGTARLAGQRIGTLFRGSGSGMLTGRRQGPCADAGTVQRYLAWRESVTGATQLSRCRVILSTSAHNIYYVKLQF